MAMYTTWAFHPPLPGYEFSDIIGQGGYGVVKLARQLATGRDVAVKIFLQERRASSSGSVAREASLMRSLQHPHILQLLEEQQQGRFVFLVMELASRGTLECYVHEQGGLGEQEASLLFAQILSAMEYCHTSCIAHRDIKPGNILLDSNMRVKLADFGLSCRLPKGTRIRGFHGTPEYCAPETFSGEEYDAFLADMWSVGVTLFEMVTATLPFTGDTAEELQNRIVAGGYVLPRSCSPALTELLGFLLSVEAWARFTAHIARTHWWFGSCAQEPQDSPVPREDSVTLLELLSVPQDLKDRQYLSELGLLPGSTAQGTPEPAAHKSGCQPPCCLPSAGSHGAQDSLHLSSFHSDSVCFTPSSSTASLSSEPSGESALPPAALGPARAPGSLGLRPPQGPTCFALSYQASCRKSRAPFPAHPTSRCLRPPAPCPAPAAQRTSQSRKWRRHESLRTPGRPCPPRRGSGASVGPAGGS